MALSRSQIAWAITEHGKVLLPPRSRSTGVGLNVSLIQIGLDESGKLQSTDKVAFGGCALENAESHRFGSHWISRLDKGGIHSIHMKDAMRMEGHFKGKREPERDELFLDLAKISRDHHSLLLAAVINNQEFLALSQQEQERLKNPVYCGFEACVRGMLHHLPNSKDHSIQIACDLSEEYSVKLIKLFNRLRAGDAIVKDVCHAITFADDEYVPTLQLADMFAYCVREIKDGAPRPIISQLMTSLIGTPAVIPKNQLIYHSGTIELGMGKIV